MSHHLGQSIPPPDEQRRQLLEQEASNSHLSRPDEPGTAVAEEGGPVVQAGADATALPATASTPEAKGTAEPTLQMQEQSCLPSLQPLPGKQIPPGLKKDLARSRTAGGKAATACLTKRAQEQTIQRQQEPGRQSQSPHPPVAHAWFVVFSPLTASGQRTEVTASSHKSGKGDRVVTATSPTNIWTRIPPPRPTAGRSRNRSRRERSKRGRQRSEYRNRSPSKS